jgi:hypothetical protein
MHDRHETRRIVLSGESGWVIGVVSDTHGKPHPNLIPLLKEERPALILHAGDVGNIGVIGQLEEVGITVFVRGNVDPAGAAWPDSLRISLQLGKSAALDLLLLHFAISGLRLTKDVLTLLRENPARILVFGHSHIPFLGTHGEAEGKTYLFNPGSAGPRRFSLPTTMGFIRISSTGLKFNHVDLDTREPWSPR